MSLDASPIAPVRSFQAARPVEMQASLVGASAALPWIVAGCLVGTAVYVVIDDPGDGDGGLTPCPIRALTGQWCPGCGLTRATHHLFRGDVARALSFNATLPLVLAGLVLLWVTWLMVATGRGVPSVVRRIRPAVYVTAALALTGFTVVRNLTGAAFLRGA